MPVFVCRAIFIKIESSCILISCNNRLLVKGERLIQWTEEKPNDEKLHY